MCGFGLRVGGLLIPVVAEVVVVVLKSIQVASVGNKPSCRLAGPAARLVNQVPESPDISVFAIISLNLPVSYLHHHKGFLLAVIFTVLDVTVIVVIHRAVGFSVLTRPRTGGTASRVFGLTQS